MKRSSLLYLTLVTVLLAGLAHLRSDWLGSAPERPEPAQSRATASGWTLRPNEPHVWWSFLRQR